MVSGLQRGSRAFLCEPGAKKALRVWRHRLPVVQGESLEFDSSITLNPNSLNPNYKP